MIWSIARRYRSCDTYCKPGHADGIFGRHSEYRPVRDHEVEGHGGRVATQ